MTSAPVVRPREAPDTPALEGLGLHPVLRRVVAGRGVAHPGELDWRLAALAPVDGLSGLQGAVALLERALRERWRILVLGDFDADGATSSALAVRALRAFGASAVDYLVPNRFEFGYGLTPEIVEVAAGREPDLIITVDNGISSLDGVAAARARGIRVLVTDHHLPGVELPAAEAIVNPNLDGDGFPSKHLAGVGVIFYLLSALRATLRDGGWFGERGLPEPSMAGWLDLVALGTVADVVPLDLNNRILVEQGLRRIRAGHCVPGIAALVSVSGRSRRNLVAADLGFALGPRINAAGRLDDMSQGIECLLADSPEAALALAENLHGLNAERREIERRMQDEALRALERLLIDIDEEQGDLPGLVLHDPGWHQGVIGILAGRLKDRLHRPVIVLADASEDELKGSMRSIPGLHARDLLEAVATRHPGLLTRFGGHAMAAGLSLRRADLPRFTEALLQVLEQRASPETLQRVILTDGAIPPAELTLELARTLRFASPWGQGFPLPLFEGRFEVLSARVVGERHLKLRLRAGHGHPPVDAIAFNAAEPGVEQGAELRLLYRIDVNEYLGCESLQLVVERFLEG